MLPILEVSRCFPQCTPGPSLQILTMDGRKSDDFLQIMQINFNKIDVLSRHHFLISTNTFIKNLTGDLVMMRELIHPEAKIKVNIGKR